MLHSNYAPGLEIQAMKIVEGDALRNNVRLLLASTHDQIKKPAAAAQTFPKMWDHKKKFLPPPKLCCENKIGAKCEKLQVFCWSVGLHYFPFRLFY